MVDHGDHCDADRTRSNPAEQRIGDVSTIELPERCKVERGHDQPQPSRERDRPQLSGLRDQPASGQLVKSSKQQ